MRGEADAVTPRHDTHHRPVPGGELFLECVRQPAIEDELAQRGREV